MIGVEAGRLLGMSFPDETLERGLPSEAAQRTPPGKRPAGTEINPTLWQWTIYIHNNTKIENYIA